MALGGSHRGRGDGVGDVSNMTLRFNHNTTEANSTDYGDGHYHVSNGTEVGSSSWAGSVALSHIQCFVKPKDMPYRSVIAI